MIIVGDIGNTETKICFVNSKKKILKKINIKTKNINYSTLKKSVKFSNLNRDKLKKCLFSSVVPKSFKLIKIYFKNMYNINCYELKKLPLKSLITIRVNKKQIGSDRLANAISLSNNKQNYIILDFGTATTFDVLVKNVYYGGVIAPGVNLSLKTLIKKAILIPNLNLKKTNKVIGKNTIFAVRSGFFWGYTGLIDKIIGLIRKETKKTFKIILTGGYGHLFKNVLNTKAIVNKDITINGLIKATQLIKNK